MNPSRLWLIAALSWLVFAPFPPTIQAAPVQAPPAVDPQASSGNSWIIGAASQLKKRIDRKLDLKLISDCERIAAGGDEIRIFRLRPEIKVTRDRFFETYGESLGLNPETDRMTEKSVFIDNKGFTHSRWEQTHRNLPVLGAGFSLTERKDAVEAKGESGLWIDRAVGRSAPFVDVDPAPSLSESEALGLALKAIGAETYSWESLPDLYEVPSGRLAISSANYENKDYRLVYQFHISSQDPLGAWDVQIDAKTGNVVNRFNELSFLELTWGENKTATGLASYYGSKTITANQLPGGSYQLLSMADPSADPGKGLQTDVLVADFRQDDDSLQLLTDNDGNFEQDEAKPGVALKWGLERALAYFGSAFGWSGTDNGVLKLGIVAKLVDLGGEPNAYYEGLGRMSFHAVGPNPMVHLRTVGHEFTHGIISQTSNLGTIGESGALHEGFADVFGVLISAYGLEQSVDWNFGDRKLNDPTSNAADRYPDTYKGNDYDLRYAAKDAQELCQLSNDWCGVHKNSTVLSHAFYLIAMGGKGVNDFKEAYEVQGIGVEKMASIAFLTMISLGSPKAGFEDARETAIEVSRSYFGENSAEEIAVKNAFHAVGVGAKFRNDAEIVPSQGAKGVLPWPAEIKAEVENGAADCEIEIFEAMFDLDIQNLTPPTEKPKIIQAASTIGGDSNVKTYCDIPKIVLEPGGLYLWRVRTKPGAQKSAGMVQGFLSGLKNFLAPKTPSHQDTGLSKSKPDGPDWGPWSDRYYFLTSPMVPETKSPRTVFKEKSPKDRFWEDAASVITAPPNPWPTEFVWGAVKGAVGYNLIVADGIREIWNPDEPGFIRKWIDPEDSKNLKGSDIKAEVILKPNHDYTWMVNASGPSDIGGMWSSEVSFKTASPKAQLQSPSNGQPVYPWAIPMSWKPVPGAGGYLIYAESTPQISDQTSPKVSSKTTQTNAVSLSGTSPGYWAVRPLGPDPDNDPGALSDVWQLVPDNSLTKPELVNPLVSVPFGQASVRYIWKRVPGANQYHVKVFRQDSLGCSESASNGGILFETTSPGTALSGDKIFIDIAAAGISGDASDKSPRCWQVTPFGPNQAPGTPSVRKAYQIGPAQPSLISPAHGALGVPYHSMVFTWECAWAPDGFKLQIHPSNSTQASDTIVVDNIGDTNLLYPPAGYPALAPNTQYTWTVTAKAPASGFAEATESGWEVFTTKEKNNEQTQQGSQSGCPPIEAPTWLNPLFDGQALNGNIKWTRVEGAHHYVLRRYNGLNCTYESGCPFIDEHQYTQASANASFIDAGPLSDPVNLYVAVVRAVNGCGNWSPDTSDNRIIYVK